MQSAHHALANTRRRSTRAVAVAALAFVPLACGSDDSSAVTNSSDAATTKLDVVASFYPLAYIVQRIGGDLVSVDNLTPQGGEPHELELTASDTAHLSDADLIVYLAGFAPAVDEGIVAEGKDNTLDVTDVARLDLRYTPIENGAQNADEARARDPHFWLDPTRLIDVATAITDRLANENPAQAETFRTNAAALVSELQTLDHEYETGLANCLDKDIVTSHNAFGYLSERYGLTQVGITGLTPEDEPTPADLAVVTKFVEDNDVTTIYYETLVSPAIAETVASETGVRTEVLDPIEGLSDSSQGTDYFGIMRSNLVNLRMGQDCS